MRHKKLPLDFVIQTDHLISAIQPDQKIVNKKKEKQPNSDFTVSADYRVKIRDPPQKKDKYYDLARELKNYGTRR